MKPFLKGLALLSLTSSLLLGQEAPLPPDAPADSPAYPVWPDGKMPGTGAAVPETTQPPNETHVIHVVNVSHPIVTVVKPAHASAPTPAVVVCPGGGYGGLAYNKEGTEIAEWLSSFGVTGVVLKYRVPNNRDGALQDVERAVRLVRAHAAEWNIDPKRVGVMGFSAGGHLCARLSTNFGHDAYPPIDEVDIQSCRPDFTVLVYPAYLEQNGKDGVLAPELPVSAQVPPTLIVHTEDDHAFVGGSKLYHAALDQAGVANTYLLYPREGHGYGLRATKDAKVWPDRCQDWLRQTGILPPVTAKP